MKDKPAAKKSSEEQLVERLRAHPEMMERFEAILGLTESGEGPIRKADDVEGWRNASGAMEAAVICGCLRQQRKSARGANRADCSER